MSRGFFDIHDGGSQRDDTGTACANPEAVRTTAMRLLPDIAREDIPHDGDRRTFTVLVTDEDGKAVYAATPNDTGSWLPR